MSRVPARLWFISRSAMWTFAVDGIALLLCLAITTATAVPMAITGAFVASDLRDIFAGRLINNLYLHPAGWAALLFVQTVPLRILSAVCDFPARRRRTDRS